MNYQHLLYIFMLRNFEDVTNGRREVGGADPSRLAALKQCENDFSSESDALTAENPIPSEKKPQSIGTERGPTREIPVLIDQNSGLTFKRLTQSKAPMRGSPSLRRPM